MSCVLNLFLVMDRVGMAGPLHGDYRGAECIVDYLSITWSSNELGGSLVSTCDGRCSFCVVSCRCRCRPGFVFLGDGFGTFDGF